MLYSTPGGCRIVAALTLLQRKQKDEKMLVLHDLGTVLVCP